MPWFVHFSFYSGSLLLTLLFQLKESILELLVQNFGRFNEEDESDGQGLFHVLGTPFSDLTCHP
jgi:hypothetical protein